MGGVHRCWDSCPTGPVPGYDQKLTESVVQPTFVEEFAAPPDIFQSIASVTELVRLEAPGLLTAPAKRYTQLPDRYSHSGFCVFVGHAMFHVLRGPRKSSKIPCQEVSFAGRWASVYTSWTRLIGVHLLVVPDKCSCLHRIRG